MARNVGFVTVLLPLPSTCNPDRKGRRKRVEASKFRRTAEDLTRRFGGATLHSHPVSRTQGFWWDRGFIDRDVHVLLEIDVPDTRKVLSDLRSFARNVLLRRFRQKAIYMKLVRPIERLLVTRDVVTERRTSR